jgi:hypothetical protein
MEVRVPCNQCKDGVVIENITMIAKSSHEHHVANHAYSRRPGGTATDTIGADCDCPRVTKKNKRTCIICHGTGTMLLAVKMPEPGDKVIVRDPSLLRDMGFPEFAGKVGTILAINDPKIDEADLVPIKELRVTANVTWAETNNKGKVLQRVIKENKGIETFGFTPLELRWI